LRLNPLSQGAPSNRSRAPAPEASNNALHPTAKPADAIKETKNSPPAAGIIANNCDSGSRSIGFYGGQICGFY